MLPITYQHPDTGESTEVVGHSREVVGSETGEIRGRFGAAGDDSLREDFFRVMALLYESGEYVYLRHIPAIPTVEHGEPTPMINNEILKLYQYEISNFDRDTGVLTFRPADRGDRS